LKEDRLKVLPLGKTTSGAQTEHGQSVEATVLSWEALRALLPAGCALAWGMLYFLS
jgi:hypothetical protein